MRGQQLGLDVTPALELSITVIVVLNIWFLFSCSTIKHTLSHTVNKAENMICLCKLLSVSA